MIDPHSSSVPSAVPPRPGFRRAVSRWEIVGFSVNDVIGSGVYLLPAAAAGYLGYLSVGAVVLAGFAVLLLVLCFAEAGSYFDRPGSAYLYTREAFGELVGFEVGWMTWLARVSSVASLSVGFARALGYVWPAANLGYGRALSISLPVLALTAINVVGVKSGVRTAVFLAITKTLPLLIFIGAGLFFVSPGLARSVQATHPGHLGDAVLLLLFAYAGFENTAAPAGEFKNPRRDVPFALIVQIVLVTLIYTAVQWVALGTLPGVASAQTPLADAAQRFLGSGGGLLMTVGGAISILGTNSNTVLSGPRYLWALAKDGFGPRILTDLHPKYRTPWIAVLAQTAIALPLAFTGSFEALATLSAVARLATYFGTALAVPVLRRKLAKEPAVRLPGGWTIPIAAAILCVVFAASAEVRNLIAGAIALAAGGVIYALRRRPATLDTAP
ncbi:MAG TPA: APC family permease [Thermoanaerobaculia bacterium]|nr:APC family permease [Thermoanaerobaculia bacterium]